MGIEVWTVLGRLNADCEADGDELLTDDVPEGRPTTNGALSESIGDSLAGANSSDDIRGRAAGGDRYWFVAAPRGALRTTAGELIELITELARETVEAGSGGYSEDDGGGDGDVGRDG